MAVHCNTMRRIRDLPVFGAQVDCSAAPAAFVPTLRQAAGAPGLAPLYCRVTRCLADSVARLRKGTTVLHAAPFPKIRIAFP